MPGADEVVLPDDPNVDFGDGRVPGQVYVRLSDGATGGAGVANVVNLPVYNQATDGAGVADAVVTSTGVSDLDSALSELNVSALFKLVADGVGVAGEDGLVGGGELASVILVEFDQNNSVDQAISRLSSVASVAEVSPVAWVSVSATVDDPEFPQQWSFPDIHIPEAWDTTDGDPSVVVAVVDTGCDFTHPDLAPILDGATFIPGTTTAQDDHSHGTHVAGTIAAISNNATNVAGIAPRCWILPVKVLAANGFSVGASVAQGINYAAQNARIINMSLGSGVDDMAMRIAVAVAVGRGVLVVAAMGNDGWTETRPSYPAAYPGVLAVGATDQAHHRSVWSATKSSNQGSWITVAAPGTSILSLRNGGGTSYKSGTSMATPHVSGVAALLASAKPSITASEIWTAIYQSAAILQDTPADPVPNPAYGGGLVDAAAALRYVLQPVGDFPTPTGDTRLADNEPVQPDPAPVG